MREFERVPRLDQHKGIEMYHKIVVWCKEAENMHEDPEKKIKRVIPPCVRNYYQEPPCGKHCEAITNYLKDYA